METDLKSYRSEFVPVSCNQALRKHQNLAKNDQGEMRRNKMQLERKELTSFLSFLGLIRSTNNSVNFPLAFKGDGFKCLRNWEELHNVPTTKGRNRALNGTT